MCKSTLFATLVISASLLALAGCGGKTPLDFTLGNRVLPGGVMVLCIKSHMKETFELARVQIHASYGYVGHGQRSGDKDKSGDRRSWRDRSLTDISYNKLGGFMWIDFANVEPEVEYCKPYAEAWGGTWNASGWNADGTPTLKAIYKACVSIPYSDEFNPGCTEWRT